MKERTYFLNTILAALLGAVLLVCVAVRAFAPQIILPAADIPGFVLLSVLALTADHYLAPGAKRDYIAIAVLSAVSFGLLPFAAGFVAAAEAGKLALTGGVVFTVCAWLFTSAQDRLSTGPEAKAAPALVALGLWLAAQGFAAIV